MSKRPLEEGTRARAKVFRLGPALEARLNGLARQLGITPSEAIRLALEFYIAHKEGH